jgi:hypothetical protein
MSLSLSCCCWASRSSRSLPNCYSSSSRKQQQLIKPKAYVWRHTSRDQTPKERTNAADGIKPTSHQQQHKCILHEGNMRMMTNGVLSFQQPLVTLSGHAIWQSHHYCRHPVDS